jgi:hypothetical protein
MKNIVRRNKMGKTINVGGKEFSEETVKKALENHCNFKSVVKVPLKAGDVCDYAGRKRIIINVKGELRGYGLNGQKRGHRKYI